MAGCGTTQAAHYALRWPRAQVIGIDVSANSIAFTQELKRKYALDNLEVRQLAVERAAELGRSFEHMVCTGVLHHLPDPDAGLRALRDVLEPSRRTQRDGLRALRPRRVSICFRTTVGGLASAGRRPNSATSPRASRRSRRTIPLRHFCATRPTSRIRQGWPMLCFILWTDLTRFRSCWTFLDRAGLAFGRWVRQAPYLPWCGALASTPHQARLIALTAEGAIRRHRTVPRDHGPPRLS